MGATSPCHQEHQRGQEDQWGQSDHGHHLCRENRQHLWDQHHPKDRGKPETCGGGGQGGDLECPPGVWDPSPALPYPGLCLGLKIFQSKRCLLGGCGGTWGKRPMPCVEG